MTTNDRAFWKSLACVAALALAGCDDGPAMTADGGAPAMDARAPAGDDAGEPMDGDDAGPPGGDDGGGDPPADDCASHASALCARFMACDPTGFVATWENEAICQRVVEAECADPTEIPRSNGLADEAACEAAQVADCEGFFAARTAPLASACVPEPGQVTETEGDCFTDVQCGTRDVAGAERRMYCRPLSSGGSFVFGTAECPRGSCIVARREGDTCNPENQGTREFCDRYAGQECRLEFDEDAGTRGEHRCRTVRYGETGDPCFPGSDRACASGFECDPEAKRCMAALDVGQACIPERDLCDGRRGLRCEDTGSGDVCVAPRVVGVGAQCDWVTVDGTDVFRSCSAYARCDTSMDTPVCVPLRALDEICTVDPDNCEPGLECDPSTNRCREPDPSSPSCP
ncbi:MAG TPA: hypothetical protein RMH99_32885 [Sandaracinaceae bacterium LLY-WYZ-13_1]|nr:hypothetical protein [Sandaracinaceae bacterium LLY-WYZ-13_1]